MFRGNKYCGERLICAGCFLSFGLVIFFGSGVTRYFDEDYSKEPITGALVGRYCHIAFCSRETRAV